MGRHGVATKLFLALLCVGFCIVIYQYFVLKGNDLVESIKKTTFRKAYHGGMMIVFCIFPTNWLNNQAMAEQYITIT